MRLSDVTTVKNALAVLELLKAREEAGSDRWAMLDVAIYEIKQMLKRWYEYDYEEAKFQMNQQLREVKNGH